MMEKEIVSVGKREDRLIRFNKSDDAHMGKGLCFILKMSLKTLQKQIVDAHEEIATLKNKNS